MVEGNDVPLDFREAANGSLASSSRAAAASASRSARRRRERREGEGGGGGGGGGSLRSTASAPLAAAPGGGRVTRVRRRVVGVVGDGRAPAGSNDGNDGDDDGGGRPRRRPAGPLPKVVSDLLLQTAFFGIDTTARLSRPTLDLTVNTLLPQVVAPLLAELYEHYVPARLRTWTRVLPTSTRNLWNLLRDTDAGRSLGTKVARLGEDVVDLAGSGAGRQCCVDATVALIRLLESLRTPEVRALLDQCAVGACRFVDVLGSGGAKQVWFDVSEAIWALIEVGSDRAMVTSLAEGCAQICFALENERESLNRSKRRDGGSSIASKRRRERDRRQRGTYPPGRAVVSDETGRDGFDEALRDGLNGGHDIQEEESREAFEDQVYADMDNVPVEDDGPPKRVIVTTNSSEFREANFLFPNISVDDEENDDDGSVNPRVRSDDSESEITTEMEDLRCGEEPVNHDDARTQGSTSELPTKNRGGGNAIRYEHDDKVDCNARLRGQIHQPDRHPNDDGTASEMHDAFDESILQFYRRMNEVLVESRKRDRHDLHNTARGDKPSKVDKGLASDMNATSDSARDASSATPLVSRGGFSIRKSWWKLIIISSLCGVAVMCTLWFVLGCYGFYVLILGGGHIYYPLPSLNEMHESSNIVIQIVTAKSQDITNVCDASTDENGAVTNRNRVASITLDAWNEMKLGVERALAGQQ